MLNILDCDFYFDYYTSVDSVADCKSKCRLSCRQVQIKIFFLLIEHFSDVVIIRTIWIQAVHIMVTVTSPTHVLIRGQLLAPGSVVRRFEKIFLHTLHFKAYAFFSIIEHFFSLFFVLNVLFVLCFRFVRNTGLVITHIITPHSLPESTIVIDIEKTNA